MTVILCFLHAYLKVRDRATKAMGPSFKATAEKIWHAYGAPNTRAFAQRLRRLHAWATEALPASVMKEYVLDLCDKRDQCSVSYDHEQAHRTSNLVDRLMRYIDRAFFRSQYFHGTGESAERRARALAL